jgi:hypothetical protein
MQTYGDGLPVVGAWVPCLHAETCKPGIIGLGSRESSLSVDTCRLGIIALGTESSLSIETC